MKTGIKCLSYDFSQNACNFSVPGAEKPIVYATYAYLKSLPEGNPKKVSNLMVLVLYLLSDHGKMNIWKFFSAPDSFRLSGIHSRQEK